MESNGSISQQNNYPLAFTKIRTAENSLGLNFAVQLAINKTYNYLSGTSVSILLRPCQKLSDVFPINNKSFS